MLYCDRTSVLTAALLFRFRGDTQMNESSVFSALPDAACTCGVRIKPSATPGESVPHHRKDCAFRKAYNKWHNAQTSLYLRIKERMVPVILETW